MRTRYLNNWVKGILGRGKNKCKNTEMGPPLIWRAVSQGNNCLRQACRRSHLNPESLSGHCRAFGFYPGSSGKPVKVLSSRPDLYL